MRFLKYYQLFIIMFIFYEKGKCNKNLIVNQ